MTEEIKPPITASGILKEAWDKKWKAQVDSDLGLLKEIMDSEVIQKKAKKFGEFNSHVVLPKSWEDHDLKILKINKTKEGGNQT